MKKKFLMKFLDSSHLRSNFFKFCSRIHLRLADYFKNTYKFLFTEMLGSLIPVITLVTLKIKWDLLNQVLY